MNASAASPSVTPTAGKEPSYLDLEAHITKALLAVKAAELAVGDLVDTGNAEIILSVEDVSIIQFLVSDLEERLHTINELYLAIHNARTESDWATRSARIGVGTPRET